LKKRLQRKNSDFMENIYDVIIVGAGSAGLTAAIYTCRKKLKTLVVSMDVGGQMNLTEHIENYPGYTEHTPGFPSGPNLMRIFEEQSKKFGTEFKTGKVSKITKKEKNFVIELLSGEKFECKALILAYGKVQRMLDVPGEEKFLGRGLSTCATCDAPLFKNKVVAVVGGGNSALEAAELLTKFATKVYLVHRRDAFRADEITVEKVKKTGKVEFVLNAVPKEIRGDKFVKAFVVTDVNTNQERVIDVNGVFIEIGYIIDTTIVKDLVQINQNNEVTINDKSETSCEGIFAAGDLTSVPYKQAIISAGEGAKAALSAYNYIQKIEGKPVVRSDWG
jgi:thioredoxin reductase (NADPH)